MNGKLAKRIRAAAARSGNWQQPFGQSETDAKTLKREYRARPYHRRTEIRRMLGRQPPGHSAMLRKLHDMREEWIIHEEAQHIEPSVWQEFLYSGGTYFKDQYGNRRQGEEIFPEKH